jgi:hypothetical protein
MLLLRVNTVTTDGPNREPANPDPGKDARKTSFRPWMYATFCFVLMFLVQVNFKFLARLRALGQPVSSLVLDALVFAALWAAGMWMFYWIDRKGRRGL